jgi:uncharacterized protein DUF3310
MVPSVDRGRVRISPSSPKEDRPVNNGEVKNHDEVNHPKHYTFGKFEVIEVIEDWSLGFNLGNAIKYIARAEHKGDPLVNLKKAAWYLQREIGRREVAARNQGDK